MLEVVFKGLLFWLYQLILEGVQFLADALLDVFTMDTAFFEQHAPVILEMRTIIIGVGWALLLGNLAFQSLRGMFSGVGFEAEDPKILFCRTAVFSFLLVVSPEICKIGMDLTSSVINLFSVPDSVVISTPSENAFNFGGSWLLVIVVGLIMCFQVIRLFAEVAERYVVTCVLTFLAPLAFGVGGSKSTEAIFRGWTRMYGSMCLIMVLNVFFMKILLSALATPPEGLAFFPWLLFIIGIARMGRRIDDTICRIGLNAAHTGSPLFPGAFTTMVVRQAVSYFGTGQENFFTKQRFHFGFKWPGYDGNIPVPRPSMENMQPGLSTTPPPARLGSGSPDTDMPAMGSDPSPPQGPTPQMGSQNRPRTGSNDHKRTFPRGNTNIDIFPDDTEPSSQVPNRAVSKQLSAFSTEKGCPGQKNRPSLSAQEYTQEQYAQHDVEQSEQHTHGAVAAHMQETGVANAVPGGRHDFGGVPPKGKNRPASTDIRRNAASAFPQSKPSIVSHGCMQADRPQATEEQTFSGMRRKSTLGTGNISRHPLGEHEGGEDAKNRRTTK